MHSIYDVMPHTAPYGLTLNLYDIEKKEHINEHQISPLSAGEAFAVYVSIKRAFSDGNYVHKKQASSRYHLQFNITECSLNVSEEAPSEISLCYDGRTIASTLYPFVGFNLYVKEQQLYLIQEYYRKILQIEESSIAVIKNYKQLHAREHGLFEYSETLINHAKRYG